jgi:hypothetical protein
LLPTLVRSSFGAIRMQQLSHHTLNSVLGFSTFAFTVCAGFIWFNRVLLKTPRRAGECNPRDACICPECGSTRVFSHQWAARLLPFRRCGRGQTIWACCTSDSGRQDTSACRPQAFREYSQELNPTYGLSAVRPSGILGGFDRHEEDSPEMNRRKPRLSA